MNQKSVYLLSVSCVAPLYVLIAIQHCATLTYFIKPHTKAMTFTCHPDEGGIFGLNNERPLQKVKLVVAFLSSFTTDASFLSMTRKIPCDCRAVDDVSE